MKEKTRKIVVVSVMAVFLFAVSLFCILKKDNFYSDSERRVLAKMPKISTETILSGQFMSDFETYAMDQFPMRDGIRGIKSANELFVFNKRDNNGLYMQNGVISKKEYPLNEDMLDYASQKFNALYENNFADKDVNIYLTVVPDKNYYLSKDGVRLSVDYEEISEKMQEKNKFMEYIDISDLLDVEDFYRTDTHWRQEKILDVAERLCSEMGAEFNSSYETRELENDFYGVYYGQLALPVKADRIKYLTNDVIENCVVTSYATGAPQQTTVYNFEKAVSKDPYEFFLSGADPLIIIENPNAKTDRELIVFRDSFGSSLTPLMIDGYSKITLVDIRYVQSGMVGNLVEFKDGDDILFIYSTTILNNSTGMK